MPLYEYECPKDGTFERIRKFSDPPLTACPTCGGPIEKLLSAPAIQFKGTGWYITDYAKSGGGESAKDKKERREEGAAAKASKDSSTSSASPTPSTPASSTSTDKKSTDKK